MDEVLTIREVAHGDARDLVVLVGAAYAEHPGCVLDLDGLDADLLRPTDAVRADRRWWVVEDAGRVVASVRAAGPDGHGEVELDRLYVAATHRRRGLAAHLVDRVEAYAREHGARHVALWSDSRFTEAHRLYVRLGYRDTGERRDLDDPSHTTEHGFVKRL